MGVSHYSTWYVASSTVYYVATHRDGEFPVEIVAVIVLARAQWRNRLCIRVMSTPSPFTTTKNSRLWFQVVSRQNVVSVLDRLTRF